MPLKENTSLLEPFKNIQNVVTIVKQKQTGCRSRNWWYRGWSAKN